MPIKFKFKNTNVIFQFHCPVQDCGSCNKRNVYIRYTLATTSRRLTNHFNDIKKHPDTNKQLPPHLKIIVDNIIILKKSNYKIRLEIIEAL